MSKLVIQKHIKDESLSDFAKSPYYKIYYKIINGDSVKECVSSVNLQKGVWKYMIGDLFTINLSDSAQDYIEKSILDYSERNIKV